MTLTLQPLQLNRSGRCILDVPALTLAAGNVHALLGPNGAGKSTLLSVLAGLEAGAQAHVSLDARLLANWDSRELARRRALLTQAHHVPFDFVVSDIVGMGRYPHAVCPHPQEAGLVAQSLALVEASHLQDRRYETLSGGEKARVQVARVLAQITPLPGDEQARWLLLDEPTAALDLAHQHSLMRLLTRLAREQGLGVLVVLHDLNLADAYADQVLVLLAGRVHAAGRTDQVLQPEVIQRVWGLPCKRLQALPGSALQRGALVF